MAKSRKAPELRITAAGVACAVTAAGGEGKGAKLGTFKGRAYTGATMRPQGWWREIVIDLDGVKVPSQHRPVLRQHDHEQIAGHTTDVTVTPGADGGIDVEGVFSGERQHTDKITVPAKNGFKWQLSVGANPIRTEELAAGEETEVNGRTVTGPLTISRETELGEVSFVPLGADGATSATVTASKGRTMNAKAMLKASGKYSDEDIEKMSDDEAKAALKKCMKAEDDDEEKTEAADEDDVDADDADDSELDDEEEPEKSESSKRTAVKAKGKSAKAIQAHRAAMAKESRRVAGIQAAGQKFAGVNRVKLKDGSTVDLVPHAIEAGWSAEKTERVAELHQLRSARPTAGGPHLHFSQAPVLNEAVLECAVFDALPSFKLFDKDFYASATDDNGRHIGRRCSEREERRITAELNTRYTDQVRQAAHTHFRGRIGMQQLLTTLAAASGYRGPATFNDPSGWGEVAAYLGGQIRADGASTVNTPATLSNVQNKFMLQGYMYTEQSHMEFCQVLPVKDLKPTKSVQLFGDFQFQPLNPAGEISHGSVGDNPYANQAGLEARMLQIGLQYLINDDLNMFGQIPMMLGRGWGLRVLDLVYTKFNNPGLDDGGSTSFFAATHTITGQSANANYQSGASTTLTSDGLKAAKILLDKQVDPAGKPLGIDAEILLYPPELDVPAIELMNAQFLVMAGLASTAAASKQPNTNIWKGRFRPVMSRYLSNTAYTGASATAWYLLANPNIIPVIQIAALNGQLTPTIQQAGQDWNFNMLGISMRGWGGVGVSMQNFRGAVKSAGA